jgi:uncharacterized protein (DUF1810 family)
VADPHDLLRFARAQDAGGAYEIALGELRAGRKRSHWMWYVCPQIAGLGHSSMSQRYAITSLDEARAYTNDPILGPRLVQCAAALLALGGRSAVEVLGDIDAMKLRSSMTLFARAAPDEPVFAAVLDRYFDGAPDKATIVLLG